jgi:hypothetical protein
MTARPTKRYSTRSAVPTTTTVFVVEETLGGVSSRSGGV